MPSRQHPQPSAEQKYLVSPPHGKLSIKQAAARECGQDCRQENLSWFEDRPGDLPAPEAEAAGPDSSTGLRQDTGLGGFGEISPPSPSPE